METVTVSGPWYRVSDLPPPLGVRVRVMWDGRVFEAARVPHPVDKHECWLVHDRKLGAVFLPLSGDLRRPADPGSPWSGWHTLKQEAPDYYQPLSPERWAVPLPASVRFPTVSPRMYSATPRQPREPGGGSQCFEADLASKQWWRDPMAISYAPSGSVSKRMAEGRVMRAVAACGGDGGWRLRARTVATVLADFATEYQAKLDGETRVRWHPLPQDQDDFETAMRWYAQLKGGNGRALNRVQRVLFFRSLPTPLSFDEIGWELGRSRETVRTLYARGVEECWWYANGVAGPADRKLAALKERNRKARG